MKLTKRGKRVRAIFLILVVGAVVYYLNDITTPDQCKHKTPQQMSQFCIDLLFPH